MELISGIVLGVGICAIIFAFKYANDRVKTVSKQEIDGYKDEHEERRLQELNDKRQKEIVELFNYDVDKAYAHFHKEK